MNGHYGKENKRTQYGQLLLPIKVLLCIECSLESKEEEVSATLLTRRKKKKDLLNKCKAVYIYSNILLSLNG